MGNIQNTAPTAGEINQMFGIHESHHPRRLLEATRQLAARAVSGEHGRSMVETGFHVGEAFAATLSPDMHYAHAVKLIAENAPLRITPGEKIIGSATLLEASYHTTPACPFGSTSHTTIGFDRVLHTGTRDLRRQVNERRARNDLDERGRDFLDAMLMCLDAMTIWHRRHMELLEERIAAATDDERAAYVDVLESFRAVPAAPPETFRQAVQSLWFMFAFQRLCGNWSGVGRVDMMLAPYLRADLDCGRITLDEARDILGHFWIKGCEWTGIPGAFGGTGDAQYYQNVVLSGVDADGNDVTGDVTYLVLDIVEELHISDFPIAVRVGKNTPDRLLRRIAEVQCLGGGIIAIYNEDVVLEALTKFGYSLEEARGYANDGCWEVIMPGRTAFSYAPFDMLKLLQDAVGLGAEDSETPRYETFEDLYAGFISRLEAHLEAFHQAEDRAFLGGQPSPLLSLFVDGCIEKARGYHDRGATYTVKAPHAGGLPDTANSLLVVKTLVYDEHRFGLAEFVEMLRADWVGYEDVRREVSRRFECYGNDSPAVDNLARRLFDDFTGIAGRIRERNGVLRPAGISTFGRQIEYRQHRLATFFGSRKGEILASNLSPTPGTDRHGPTSVVKSFCAMDFTRLPNGGPLDLKISPSSVKGEKGLDALVALMRTFLDMGGVFLHIDVVDSAVLRDAQKNPEKYPNLSVRISGWSARFATLNEDWQEMIIQRTEQSVHPRTDKHM